MPIAVAIVEDHPDLRKGITFMLRSSPKFNCVGEYERAEILLDEIDNTRPDVVIMDINLPGMTGIEATATLKARHSRSEILILSVRDDDESVFQAICAGASGYVTKPVAPEELLEAVENTFGGGTAMSPRIARRVLERFRESAPPPRADYQLTPREMEVLEYLTQGDDYKTIAERLFLSLFTVRAHVRNIYDKLHVHSKSQAVAKTLRERLLPPK